MNHEVLFSYICRRTARLINHDIVWDRPGSLRLAWFGLCFKQRGRLAYLGQRKRAGQR